MLLIINNDEAIVLTINNYIVICNQWILPYFEPGWIQPIMYVFAFPPKES